MDYPYSMTLIVRSYELDSFGHVNNANYLNYLEAARCEYMKQRGLSFNDFERWDAFPFIGKVEIKYKSPAVADNILEIRARICNWRRSSCVIEYEIYNQSREKLGAKASTLLIFVDSDSQLTPIPPAFRENMG
ncbi:MAG: thioesterase family protein [candidate division KSB1 bacterium]|nr:thioesterase family protein [candidate division KSB1 bacterium]